MEMLDKIIDKIQKLLALATSPNEHEASLAAEKAHELLIKHNLDLQEINEKTQLDDYEKVEVGDDRVFRKAEEKFVHNVLEKHFFVMIYTFRKKNENYGKNGSVSTWQNTRVMIVGTHANVQIAVYVRAFLVTKFYQLWMEYKRINNARPSEQQSYFAGLRDGLNKKLEEQKSRIQTERGLVLRPDPNFKEIAKREGLVKGQPIRFARSDEARASGFVDGKSIEIQKGLTSRATDSGLKLTHKS